MGTTSRLLIASLLGLLMVSCGASKKEVRTARTSGYETDFAVVYSKVLDAVRERYPQLTEDASAGVIKTSWHPIKITNDGTTDGLTGQQRDQLRAQQRNDPSMQTGALSGSAQQHKRYFIRFDIHVLGGKPWRIRVRAQASEWEIGAVPVELRGADEPHWLKGREDALYVAIYRRLKEYSVPLKTTEVADEVAEEPTDLSVYGAIPEAAAVVVDAATRAARARDFTALRGVMAEEFTWSLGGDTSADQAIVMWQADSSVLGTMEKVLAAGCASAGEARVVCPAAAVEPGYTDYRAELALVGGRWLMTAFLKGE